MFKFRRGRHWHRQCRDVIVRECWCRSALSPIYVGGRRACEDDVQHLLIFEMVIDLALLHHSISIVIIASDIVDYYNKDSEHLNMSC